MKTNKNKINNIIQLNIDSFLFELDDSLMDKLVKKIKSTRASSALAGFEFPLININPSKEYEGLQIYDFVLYGTQSKMHNYISYTDTIDILYYNLLANKKAILKYMEKFDKKCKTHSICV